MDVPVSSVVLLFYCSPESRLDPRTGLGPIQLSSVDAALSTWCVLLHVCGWKGSHRGFLKGCIVLAVEVVNRFVCELQNKIYAEIAIAAPVIG